MNKTNDKDKNPFIAHIPSSKFTYPDSCYSFIVRLNEVQSYAEIYFPPEVEIALDFNAWLTKYKFRSSESNPQLYISRLCAYGKRKAVKELLDKAKDNGAYEISPTAILEEIGNRSEVVKLEPSTDLANTVAEKINNLVAQKLETILDRNQKAIAKYEAKIAQLNEEVAAKNLIIKNLETINSKQNHKLLKLKEYERLLGVAKPRQSPFDFAVSEASDISHLNSPFKGGDLEILDPNDYDETGYNENIAPAKLDNEPTEQEARSGIAGVPPVVPTEQEISLDDIDIQINEADSGEIDLNKILSEIEQGKSEKTVSMGKKKQSV